jgi:hypothetical protein
MKRVWNDSRREKCGKSGSLFISGRGERASCHLKVPRQCPLVILMRIE